MLVITDDVPEGVSGPEFDRMLRALNPAAFASYMHHALFAFTEPSAFECLGGDPDPCCGLSSGVGEAYGELSD